MQAMLDCVSKARRDIRVRVRKPPSPRVWGLSSCILLFGHRNPRPKKEERAHPKYCKLMPAQPISQSALMGQQNNALEQKTKPKQDRDNHAKRTPDPGELLPSACCSQGPPWYKTRKQNISTILPRTLTTPTPTPRRWCSRPTRRLDWPQTR